MASFGLISLGATINLKDGFASWQVLPPHFTRDTLLNTDCIQSCYVLSYFAASMVPRLRLNQTLATDRPRISEFATYSCHGSVCSRFFVNACQIAALYSDSDRAPFLTPAVRSYMITFPTLSSSSQLD
jgi:hypothetical protein